MTMATQHYALVGFASLEVNERTGNLSQSRQAVVPRTLDRELLPHCHGTPEPSLGKSIHGITYLHTQPKKEYSGPMLYADDNLTLLAAIQGSGVSGLNIKHCQDNCPLHQYPYPIMRATMPFWDTSQKCQAPGNSSRQIIDSIVEATMVYIEPKAIKQYPENLEWAFLIMCLADLTSDIAWSTLTSSLIRRAPQACCQLLPLFV